MTDGSSANSLYVRLLLNILLSDTFQSVCRPLGLKMLTGNCAGSLNIDFFVPAFVRNRRNPLWSRGNIIMKVMELWR